MRPIETRLLRRILRARGCTVQDAKGSHEKWTTPGGRSETIVNANVQSPGVVRNVQRAFEPEFGPKWLEREIQS